MLIYHVKVVKHVNKDLLSVYYVPGTYSFQINIHMHRHLLNVYYVVDTHSKGVYVHRYEETHCFTPMPYFMGKYTRVFYMSLTR